MFIISQLNIANLKQKIFGSSKYFLISVGISKFDRSLLPNSLSMNYARLLFWLVKQGNKYNKGRRELFLSLLAIDNVILGFIN